MPLARKASLVKFRNSVRDTIRSTGRRKSLGPPKLPLTLELETQSDDALGDEPTGFYINGFKSTDSSPSHSLFIPINDWARRSPSPSLPGSKEFTKKDKFYNDR